MANQKRSKGMAAAVMGVGLLTASSAQANVAPQKPERAAALDRLKSALLAMPASEKITASSDHVPEAAAANVQEARMQQCTHGSVASLTAKKKAGK